MIKVKIRLPADQYAFLEVDTEVLSLEEAVEAYHDGMRLLKPQQGIPVKEFNAYIDRYLEQNTGDVEVLVRMSMAQQFVIQEIKKSVERLKAKANRDGTIIEA